LPSSFLVLLAFYSLFISLPAFKHFFIVLAF
jgi:hypothetical protein